MKKLGKKTALVINETLTAYATCNPCVCGCLSPNDTSSDTSDDSGGENAK